MSTLANTLLRQALQLPPTDRAELIEGLMLSLDEADARLDAQWLKEAQSRLAAYRAGCIDAVEAEQVFAELGRSV